MDRPIITYTEDSTSTSIWQNVFAPELATRLPLKLVDFTNPLRNEVYTLAQLDLDIRKYSPDIFPKFTPGAVQLNLFFVHVFIVSSEDVDVYRNSTRKVIQDWLNVVGNKKNQEWMIIYCAEKTKQNRLFNIGSSNSVYEKLKVDFNLKKDRFFHIGGGTSSGNAEPKMMETWNDLVLRIKDLLFVAIASQLVQYDDDARRLEQQRMVPGWNYCQFFILKEALSLTFEMLTIYEEALVQYDELEASFFQTMLEQGAPWFKKFGGTEGGDDNPNPFALTSKKNYRERIIQNSISIYDFRMYLFSRQCLLLNILQRPIDIFMRSSLFVSSFSRTLREYRTSLSPFFRESWTYSIVLNIIRYCDELLAICNYPSSLVLVYEGLKGGLYQYARYQLDILGVASNLMSHSFHSDPENTPSLNDGDVSFDITTPDESHIATSNEKLAQLLRTRVEFDDNYELLTQKCFRSFERCKRHGTVLYLKADLAFLYFIRQNYQKASEIFGEICFKYGQQGWYQIDTVLIERYAICQRQLKRDKDLIQCYLHLVRFPMYLELESHSFYLEELKKWSMQSKEPLSSSNSSLFSVNNVHLIDKLGQEELLCATIPLTNNMPTEFTLDSISLVMSGGEGLETLLSLQNVNLKSGNSVFEVSGRKSTIPGDYYPTQLLMNRGQLKFIYDIPPNIQRSCKVHFDETSESISFSASPSPKGDKEIHFEIHSNANALDNVVLTVTSLTSLVFLFRGILSISIGNPEGAIESKTFPVDNGVISLTSIPLNSILKFIIPFENEEEISIDHRFKIDLKGTSILGEKAYQKYSSIIHLQLGIPVEIADSLFHSSTTSISQFKLTGKEHFQTRIVSIEFGNQSPNLIPLIPSIEEFLIPKHSLSFAAILQNQSEASEVVSVTVKYRFLVKELEHFILERLKLILEENNVLQAFWRMKRPVIKACLHNLNPLHILYHGHMKIHPVTIEQISPLLTHVSSTQKAAVSNSISRLNEDLLSISYEHLNVSNLSLKPSFFILERKISPCKILLKGTWIITSPGTKFFVGDLIKCKLTFKPIIWNSSLTSVTVHSSIDGGNEDFAIGGKRKFEMIFKNTESNFEMDLVICPLKPGLFKLPLITCHLLDLKEQEGIFFELPAENTNSVVLPREESCRRYFKEI